MNSSSLNRSSILLARRRREGVMRCSAGITRPEERVHALMLAVCIAGCAAESALVTTERAQASAPRAAAGAAPATVTQPPVVAPIVAPVVQPTPPPVVAAPSVAKPEWEALLEDGVESYENGAYGNAIRMLQDVANNPQADPITRVKALKYLAFSCCVSPESVKGRSVNHVTFCRQAFDRAFAIDPKFDLSPAERGHPVWGKQFVAARNAQARKAHSAGAASGTRSAAPEPLSAGGTPLPGGGDAAAAIRP